MKRKFKTLEKAKEAARNGKAVFWESTLYTLIYNERIDEYYIKCSANNSIVGLYEPDYKAEDFFTLKPANIMRAKVVMREDEEADIFMEDGGHATIYHNGENFVTMYYQNRIPNFNFKDTDITDDQLTEINEGETYFHDWEKGRNKISIEMIRDAINWLNPTGENTFEIFDNKPKKEQVPVMGSFDENGDTI